MAFDILRRKRTTNDWNRGAPPPPPPPQQPGLTPQRPSVRFSFESIGSNAPWIVAALSAGAAVFAFLTRKTTEKK